MENANREIAIKMTGVKKRYRLGQIGGGTLQADLQSWWAMVRGKEDPNSKIGQEQRLVGQTFMALNGIDLTIYKGEAVGIIGTNGAGKSTLLKLLSRVTAPTEGEIDIYGRIASMLEVGTGFSGEMTGRENVYMNGAILGMTKAEIDAKMDEIIEFSEVRDFIDTPVKRYSSGMYVKLAFSVAAHLDSEIMIMDEVLAVGDMAFQKKCLTKMKEAAQQEGRTVLYVSHNMNTIRQLCERCIVLDKGKIVFVGDVEEAINMYLGNENKDEQTKVFTEKNHEKWCNQKLFVESVSLENNISNIYCTDILVFNVKYRSVASATNLKARLVLMDSNHNTVGMAISRNEISIEENSEGSFSISFDTESLACGQYYFKFSLFEISEFGNHDYVCVINKFFSFTLNDKPEAHSNMVWSQKSWGHIAFPFFEIKE